MNELFLDKILSNHNFESFLPQNMPTSFLIYIIGKEETAIDLMLHGLSVLYRERFRLPKYYRDELIQEYTSFLSSIEIYVKYILQELEYRLESGERSLPDVRDIIPKGEAS